MNLSLDELQSEVSEWAEENFPGQPPVNPERGIYEELGEFAEAAESGDMEAIEDAIGDVVIYCCDFTAKRDLPLSECIQAVDEDDLWLSSNTSSLLLYAAGRIAHSELKLDQEIREDDDDVGDEATMKGVGLLLLYLNQISGIFGTTIDRCVERAWGEVSEREWDSGYK